MMPVFVGWTAIDMTRPEVTAGPMSRALIPPKVSAFSPGFFGASGVGVGEAAGVGAPPALPFLGVAGADLSGAAGVGEGDGVCENAAEVTARTAIEGTRRRVISLFIGNAILPAIVDRLGGVLWNATKNLFGAQRLQRIHA